LLVRITIHKSLQHVTFHKAAKRDPAQELGQEDSAQQGWQAVLAREPGPEEEIAFLDSLENFLAKLSPLDRQILEMRVQGYSNREIEDKLGVYDRKVRRVLERIRGIAEQEGLGP